MGKQIIKQPNNKYCIFSTIIDNVTDYNMSVDEIVEVLVDEAKMTLQKKVKSIITKLENGEKPYYRFTHSYEDMLVIIKENHGKEEYQLIKSLIEDKI